MRRLLAVGTALALAGCAGPPSGTRLLTNEFAYRHAGDPRAVRSADWIVTSGSLFRHGGDLWSGPPDGDAPGPASTAATGSAVLRAVTRRDDHLDAAVSFSLLVSRFTTTGRTEARDFDGVHVMLRYRSEESAYFVSVNRRDGTYAIKRKTPGGKSNGGTYRTLAEGSQPVLPRLGSGWRHVAVAIHGTTTVTITLHIDGVPVLRSVSTGPARSAAGRIGLRGDNCEFFVRDIRIGRRSVAWGPL
jgi:hypothetical protein